MDLLIRIKDKKDYKFLRELTKRMGLSTSEIPGDDHEDIGLLLAMKEGKKSGIANEKSVMEKLEKIASKK